MAENKLTEIIEASLEQIKNVVDANTIIGNPITTPGGTTVIPVSKVSIGFASGGLDYLGKNMKKAADSAQRPASLQTNFGGGGGTGVSVQPVGFLVISPTGNVELLNVGPNTAASDKFDSISNLIEKSPDIISKIKAIFNKDKPAASAAAATSAAAADAADKPAADGE